MIPKLIHFVWSGNHALPSYAERNIQLWRESQPDYEVKFWYDANLPELNEDAKWAFANGRNSGETSDVIRHNILRLYGGFSVDIDIVPVASMNALQEEAGRFCEDTSVYASGLVLDDGSRVIGSQPGGALITEMCSRLKGTVQRGIDQYNDLRAAFTGYSLVMDCLTDPAVSCQTAVVSGRYFPISEHANEGMIGVHDFAGEWLKQLDAKPVTNPPDQQEGA